MDKFEVIATCPRCRKEGTLYCPNCQSLAKFTALNGSFAECSCGNKLEKTGCNCGATIFAKSFKKGRSASSEEIQAAEKRFRNEYSSGRRCKNCGSDRFHKVNRKGQFDNANAATGCCFFGPTGILCGMLTPTETVTLCSNCFHEQPKSQECCSGGICLLPFMFIGIGALGRLIQYLGA